MYIDGNYDFQGNFQAIADSFSWLIDVIAKYFEDIAQIGVVVGDVAAMIPAWFSTLPVVYTTILGFGFGVAVVYKIVGR